MIKVSIFSFLTIGDFNKLLANSVSNSVPLNALPLRANRQIYIPTYILLTLCGGYSSLPRARATGRTGAAARRSESETSECIGPRLESGTCG